MKKLIQASICAAALCVSTAGHALDVFANRTMDAFEIRALDNVQAIIKSLDNMAMMYQTGQATMDPEFVDQQASSQVKYFNAVIQASAQSSNPDNLASHFVRSLIFASHDATVGVNASEQAKPAPLMLSEDNFKDAVLSVLKSRKTPSDFMEDVKAKYPTGSFAVYVNSINQGNAASTAVAAAAAATTAPGASGKGAGSTSAGSTSAGSSGETATTTTTTTATATATATTANNTNNTNNTAVIPSTSLSSSTSSSTLVAGPASPGSTGGLSSSGAISSSAGSAGFSPSGGFGSSGGFGVPAGFGSFGSSSGSGGFAGSGGTGGFVGNAGSGSGEGGAGRAPSGVIPSTIENSSNRQTAGLLADRISSAVGLNFTDVASTSQLNQTTSSGSSAVIPAVTAFSALSNAVVAVGVVDPTGWVEAGALASVTFATDGSLKGFVNDASLFHGMTTAATVCTIAQCPQGETIRWGVWSNGDATVSGVQTLLSSSVPMHYIVGTPTTPAQFAALSGQATYVPIGGTTPAGSDGRTYTATIGNIAVNFTGAGSATLSSYALSGNGINSADFTFTSVPLSLGNSGTTAKTIAAQFVSNSAGNYLGLNGFFAGGANAPYIGAAINVLQPGSGFGPGTTITQVQAFKK